MPDFDAEEQELYAAMGKPAASCPPLELLLAADEGVLPEDASQRIAAHVAGCGCCRMLLEDMKTLPQAELTPAENQRIESQLARARGDIAGQSQSGGMWWRGIAAAAVLAAVAFGVRHIWQDQREVATVAPTAVPASAPPPMMATLEIPLRPLAPPNDASTTLQTRGSGGDEPSTELLLPAFEAYNHGDYSVAVQRFAPLARTYPHSELVGLYMGVSQLLAHQEDAAYQTLAPVRESRDRKKRDEARWYSAVAVQRLRPEEARSQVSALCADVHSVYSAESCRLVGTASR